MNFKTIQIILVSIAFLKIVLSSPIINEIEDNALVTSEISDDDVDDMSYNEDDIIEVKDLDTDDISGKAIKESEIDVCATSECAEASSRILNNMNLNADPCEDFYQFTCGKFMDETIFPDDKESINTFNIVHEENINILRNILESDYKENKNLTAEQQELDKKLFGKLKDFYNTCMDVDTINSKGKEPIIKFIDELEIQKNKDSYKTADGLADLVAKLSSFGIPIFIDLSVENELTNPEKTTIFAFQTSMTLGTKEKYENNNTISYYQYVVKNIFINIFGDEKSSNNNSDKRDFDKLSKSIVELEKKLINISISPESINDISFYIGTNVKSLNEKYPYINWTSLLGKRIPSTSINDDSSVTYVGSSYFESLGKILKETDVDTISAYAEFLIIKNFVDFVSDDIKQPVKTFTNRFLGVTKEKERYILCINLMEGTGTALSNVVGGSMDMALSKYFVKEVFNSEIEHSTEDLINNIKEAMKNRIPQMSWIDKQTGDEAIEKINTILDKIGYPEYLMDPEKLDEEYKNLEIVNNDFFTNIVNIAKYSAEKSFLDVYKPKDKTKFDLALSFVDAYYSPFSNDITFPAGILRSPFFSLSIPDYLNYGAIGSVIGHEITHAFDNEGKKFDSEGRLRNWWTNSTAEEFDRLAQCFIDQYSNYTIQDENGEQINVNGLLTLGENLADNGGLTRSYEAYKKNGKNHQALPGLTQFTSDQLFYISYGQTRCLKMRPEIASYYIYTDSHAPMKYRLNGVVSNSKHFAETFKCKTGSPMNPEKKCLIW